MTIYLPTTDADRAPLTAWAMQRLPGAGLGFGEHHAVGIIRRGELACVAIYYNFRGEPGYDLGCEISFASDDPLWATRQTVTFILYYPLISLNCRRITAITEANNDTVHELLEGVGFKREGRHLDMFASGPGITYGMTQRWFLKSKWYRWYGKEIRAYAA